MRSILRARGRSRAAQVDGAVSAAAYQQWMRKRGRASSLGCLRLRKAECGSLRKHPRFHLPQRSPRSPDSQSVGRWPSASKRAGAAAATAPRPWAVIDERTDRSIRTPSPAYEAFRRPPLIALQPYAVGAF